jgi:uncharacterized protein (TIRG00374 family)
MANAPSRLLKKSLVVLLKIGIPVAIVAYLVWDAAGTKNPAGENVFQQLVNQPKHWGMLAAAWLFCAAGVVLTLIRWWYLVRALGIPLSFRGALRIGFLGFLFNLAPLGIVGGDLLKAWMLAWEHRTQQAKAVASVVVDRLTGLYLLFVLATAAILLTGFYKLPDEKVQMICKITYALTLVGGVGLGILLIPGLTDGKGTRALGRLPRVGHAIESLIGAMRMYRRMPVVLTVSAIMSIGVHSLFAIGVYLIARGLPGDVFSPSTYFVLSPLSAATGALPLSFGPYELVLELLYTSVPQPGVSMQPGQGLLVALGYRVICVLIAIVGVCYYLTSRREVAEVLHEAEQEP